MHVKSSNKMGVQEIDTSCHRVQQSKRKRCNSQGNWKNLECDFSTEHVQDDKAATAPEDQTSWRLNSQHVTGGREAGCPYGESRAPRRWPSENCRPGPLCERQDRGNYMKEYKCQIINFTACENIAGNARRLNEAFGYRTKSSKLLVTEMCLRILDSILYLPSRVIEMNISSPMLSSFTSLRSRLSRKRSLRDVLALDFTRGPIASVCVYLLILLVMSGLHNASACYKFPPGVQDPCEGQVCKFGAECMSSMDGKIARCQCPSDCPSYGDNVGSKPVCGNDGNDYANMCELRKAACYRLEDIRVKYYGKCDPCEGHVCDSPKVCQVNAQREPECRCSFHCSTEINLVCGSDGRTYSNQCLLRKQACKSRKDIRLLYLGKCTPDNPCAQIQCGPEEECSVDRSGQAVCVCPPPCEPVLRRVCGNDSTTYDNECELRRTSCIEKVYVVVKHPGPCGSDSVCRDQYCGYGAVCVEHNGKAVCECPQCTEEYKPVCGDNGITYQNECKMRQENCQREENVKVKQEGACAEGCGNQRCEYYAVCESINGKPRCVCPTSCVKAVAPVCGNDGVTYENECELRVEACRRKKLLTISSIGTCDKCKNITCSFHAKCENGICVCPILCATVNEPVCGTDDVTYHNECEMRKHSCTQNTLVSVRSLGMCGDDMPISGSGDVCNCNPMGSFSTTCDPKSKQCTCKPGVGGKRCDRCEIGYWGLHKIGESGSSGCIPCNCNKFGSYRDDCDQMTGRCMCKPNIMGMKCDRCPNGKVLGPEGCREQFTPTSCEDISCRYGATCREEPDGTPACFCDHKCDSSSHPSEIVCGTDGQNFGSLCQLQYFACRLQQDISVANTGPCKGAPPVPATTISPVTKSRKTTRHIDGSGDPYIVDSSAGRNTSSVSSKGTTSQEQEQCSGANIDNLCLSNEDCCPRHSHCRSGLCYCMDGYIPSQDNTQCYEVKTRPTEKIDSSVDACTHNPCHFGTCLLDKTLGFRCACPLGKTGTLCKRNQEFTTPSFSGRSHLEVRRIDKATQELSIDIVFAPLNKDGIILFNSQNKDGSGDFVSLTMNDGYVEFRFDLGAGPAILRSRDPVEPIRSHRIIARRVKESGILIVDNDEAVTGSSPFTLTALDLGDPMYLGYIPRANKEIFNKVGVDLGLVGCIHSLRAGSPSDMYTYNLAYSDDFSDLKAGVDITECGSNPCKSIPCKNGGTCLALDTQNFECRCPNGYKGRVCENLVNPCASQPCINGGKCVPMTSTDGFFCQCAIGFKGPKCESEVVPEVFIPQFTGDSYLEIPVQQKLSNARLTITIWFMATKPDGLLLLVTQSPGGKGDFIAITLENKIMVFTFFLGSGVGRVEHSSPIHLDKWHQVNIHIFNNEGQISVDGSTPVIGIAKGQSNMLNIDNRPLYLGGFSQKEDVPSRLGPQTGFTGAIQRIIINGHTIVGLMAVAGLMRNISTYNGPPCNVSPCMNGGVCVPILSHVECRCPTNYIGERCEKRFEQVDKDQPIHFDGATYLSFPNEVTRKVEGQQTNSFTITFRTTKDSGIMLLQRGGETLADDYLCLYVKNNELELSFNLGKQAANLLIIRSRVKVTDGQWHTAKVVRQQTEGSLQVDNGDTAIGNSLLGTQQLDTDGILWVGGHHSIPWWFPVSKNFIGCIESVEINGQTLHLVNDRLGQNTAIAYCAK